MPVVKISSSDKISIDSPFKVSAGPGAGKTYWLVNHIANVLQSSNKLGSTRKVACITYTNIAVETISRRLSSGADRVEVSTIHSFLYNNIVRPYFSFIASEYEFAISELDGHDEHYVGRTSTKNWIANHPSKSTFAHPYTERQMLYGNAFQGIKNWLKSISYSLNGASIEIKADDQKAFYFDNGNRRNVGKSTCLDKLRPGLWEYKKQFWRRGVMHHDDVLLFAYKLLIKYPFIFRVIRAKFPYFFIDEFQDTNPIQSAILRMFASAGIVVGVIGDEGQAIYNFQGATPSDFINFSLSNLLEFQILDNRRSTNKILAVLNAIRTNMSQNGVRNVDGNKPAILVGTLTWAIGQVRHDPENHPVVTLSRDNLTANSIKRNFSNSGINRDLVSELLSTDSNTDRRRVMVTCITAVELAREGRFKDAIREMSRNQARAESADHRKAVSFKQLQMLLAEFQSFKSQPLKFLFELVKANVRTDLSALRAGAILDFYNQHIYEDVAIGVKIQDDDTMDKTVHKAKGDEFPNVLVVLKDVSDLNFLLKPDMSKEENRIFYVAASRAKDELSLTVPQLDSKDRAKLSHLFNIIDMNPPSVPDVSIAKA